MLRHALILAIVAGCGGKKDAPAPARDAAAVVDEPADAAPGLPAIDWAAHGLADAGCFVARDLASGAELVSDEARCARARRPNSTFKIPNALIGLDLGILAGPDAVMTYDGKAYPREAHWSDAWTKDQPLRKAIEISAVPHFRRLATQIGAERMQQYLDRLDYGNRDTSGGVDLFWLRGGLRITAREQIDFVGALARQALPVSAAAQAAMHEVLLRDTRDGARIFHKTGSGKDEDGADRWVGWLVGWIEHGPRTLAFAMWVEDATFDAMAEKRTRTFDGVAAALLR